MSAASAGTPSGTTLAFDFGTRRIGVAVGERALRSASALCTVEARDGTPDWNALDPLVAEWRPGGLVVGVPHRADGSEGTLAGRARRFGAAVAHRYGLPVFFVDESLTSREADAELRRRRRSGMLRRRVRRDDSDRIAARLILETWMAQQIDNDDGQTG